MIKVPRGPPISSLTRCRRLAVVPIERIPAIRTTNLLKYAPIQATETIGHNGHPLESKIGRLLHQKREP